MPAPARASAWLGGSGLSLRLKLSLLWSLLSLLVLLGLEAVALAVLGAQLNGELDRDLALEARQYQQEVAGAANLAELQGRATAFLQQDASAGKGLAAAYVVSFSDGTQLTNTGDAGLRAAMTSAQQTAGQPVTVQDPRRGDIRVAVIPIEQGGRQVGDLRIALPLATTESAIRNLLTPILVADATLIVLGGALAYAVIGGGLSPLRTIAATAASISEGDLSRRIGYRAPADQVGQLAEMFRAMLGRLESGFAQRQAFYSLASHELRTPLTIVRGHLEVLRRMKRLDPIEVNEALDIVLEELAGVIVEVNDMLFLGRMLLGQPGPMEELDAGAVLRDVHRRARGLAVRDWQLEISGPAPVRGDAEQLSRALLNLVTNAVRHTREGERVRLACTSWAGWTRLEVADSGDGIRPADLAHVFSPWYRASGGADSVGGLGLMIVREVARTHGGDAEVQSKEAAGTTFTIRLPALVEVPTGRRPQT